MDNCVYNNKWLKSSSFKNIIDECQQVILTLQYPMYMPPEVINKFDFILLFAEDSKVNMKKLYEYYCGIFRTYKSFEQEFTQLTENDGCMVINMHQDLDMHL